MERGYEQMLRLHGMLLPVRCADDARAFVPVERTRYRSVVARDASGRPRLGQVMAVECDTLLLEEWRYTPKGREPLGQGQERMVADLPGGFGP